VNGWAVCALVVIGGPLLLLVRWVVSDWRRERRRRRFIAEQQPDWSVPAIMARVEQERAEEEAVTEQTDLLPRVPPHELRTEVLPTVVLPRRERRYSDRLPTPYHRRRMPLQPPAIDLMQQVLDGLRQLDHRPDEK
jgi:hypothetical protein